LKVAAGKSQKQLQVDLVHRQQPHDVNHSIAPSREQVEETMKIRIAILAVSASTLALAQTDIARAGYSPAPEHWSSGTITADRWFQLVVAEAGVVLNLPWNPGDKRSEKKITPKGQTTNRQKMDKKAGPGNGNSYRRGALWDAGTNGEK
jgi:hypothetical protein